MNKIIVIAAVVFLAFISGCHTIRNTAYGIAGIGKGIADDVYSVYKAVEKGDKWLQENYW